jgi:hypothetical protein
MPVLVLDDADDDLFGSRQRGRSRASTLLDQADVSLRTRPTVPLMAGLA